MTLAEAMENKLPKRKGLRLRNYDYDTPGAYFVTFCTNGKRKILSNIVGAIHESPELELTKYGEIVEMLINRCSAQLDVAIDSYVIMPNHIHLMFIIPDNERTRAIRESPLRGRSIISKAVGYIKMNASKEIKSEFGETELWQRGFHDHIIRSRADYEEISKYISENPLRWQLDCFYTE